MAFRTLGAAIVSLGLVTAPVHAAQIEAERAGAPVEGEQFAGSGVSDGLVFALLAAALVAFVVVAADDDDDDIDLPTSP